MAILCGLMFYTMFLGVSGNYNYGALAGDLNENRAGRLFDLLDKNSMELAYGNERSLNGETKPALRQSSDTEDFASSDFIDYTMFGPMVDEALVGDYCNREYFGSVIEACNEIVGYSAVTLNNMKPRYTPAQIAANLTETTNATFCREMVTFAPKGKVTYTADATLDKKECSILIFTQSKAKVTLTCNVPDPYTQRIYFKIIRTVSNGADWETVIPNVATTHNGSVTLLLVDQGDFTGSTTCTWSSQTST